MKVRVVSYEDVNAWILGKFARKLQQELEKLGVEVDISSESDPAADINHHIIYLGYNQETGKRTDTLMITHIDKLDKLALIKKQLKVAALGVCMSKEVMNDLVASGIPAEKLCYINPAHDSVIEPRPLLVGIFSKVHGDGRKRERLLNHLLPHISPKHFRFVIMGEGWDEIVEEMNQRNFQVDLYREFDYQHYIRLIPGLDYFLYLGQDEGSMGFIDALAAGVKTIVTPQGYHLDAENGITHAFNTFEELLEVFHGIQAERMKRIDSVKYWTWEEYARKHLAVWDYLLHKITPGQDYLQYADGLNSLLNTAAKPAPGLGLKLAAQKKIFSIMLSRFYYSKDKFGKIRRLISLTR